jgi:hypothetical protein
MVPDKNEQLIQEYTLAYNIGRPLKTSFIKQLEHTVCHTQFKNRNYLLPTPKVDLKPYLQIFTLQRLVSYVPFYFALTLIGSFFNLDDLVYLIVICVLYLLCYVDICWRYFETKPRILKADGSLKHPDCLVAF